MTYKIGFTTFLISAMFPLIGQQALNVSLKDTALILSSYIIKPISTPHKIKLVVNTIDNPLHENGFYTRNYGKSGIATAAVRGANANHTNITWNGLTLNSPLSGVFDLNVLPSFVWSTSSMLVGGDAVAFGSGAAVAVIKLNDSIRMERNTSFSATFGNFNTQRYNLEIKRKYKKLFLSFQGETISSTNNFSYQAAENVFKKNENSRVKKENMLFALSYSPTNTSIISAQFWYSNSWRQIPPTTVQNSSQAYQTDHSVRGYLSWINTYPWFKVQVKSLVQKDSLQYVDPLIRLIAPNRYSSLQSEVFFQTLTTRNQLQLSIVHSFLEGNSNSFLNTPTENRIATNLTYLHKRNNFDFNFGLRQEILQPHFIPVGHVAASYKKGAFHSKLNIQRIYRLPSFNERFWSPGGNVDILPESGFAYEFSQKLSSQKYILQLNAFRRDMRDQIIWIPKTGGGNFFATNLQKTSSRGIEAMISITPFKGFDLSSKYSWVLNKSVNDISFPATKKNDDMYYSPRHIFNATGSYTLGFLIVKYNIHGQSSSKGFNEKIKPFLAHNLAISTMVKTKKVSIYPSLSIQNLTNTTYYIFERRPVAGRHILFETKLIL